MEAAICGGRSSGVQRVIAFSLRAESRQSPALGNALGNLSEKSVTSSALLSRPINVI